MVATLEVKFVRGADNFVVDVEPTYAAVLAEGARVLGIAIAELQLSYKDADGDLVRIIDDASLKKAIASHPGGRILKIFGQDKASGGASASASAAGKRARVLHDVSERFVHELLALPVDCGSPASKASLSTLVEAPLTGLKIFLPPGNDGLERVAAGTFSFADLPDDDSMEKLLALLQNAAWHDMDPLGTEEVVATVADGLTGRVWAMLDKLCSRLRLTSARDSTDPSGATIQNARPDYCLWASDRLLLKAEHKLDDGSLDVAKRELAQKLMDWRLPGLRELPFLPGYAVGGRYLQFCVLQRAAADPLLTERVDIGPLFRMDSAEGRLRIVAASFNIYRLLVWLVELLPERVPQLYGVHKRPTGVVEVLGSHIVKTCSQLAADAVYNLLKARLVPNSITLTSYEHIGENVRLEERPVSVQRLPQTEAELAAAVKAVLEALVAFHARGFVHRDVRWPNVLADNDRWLLTDFELAARDGTRVPPGAISPEHLPPEVAAAPATAPYTAAGDVFRVGRLLVTSGVTLGSAAVGRACCATVCGRASRAAISGEGTALPVAV